MSLRDCNAELCPHWDGDTCPCATSGINQQENDAPIGIRRAAEILRSLTPEHRQRVADVVFADEPALRTVRVQVCEPCIRREGSECHTPSCLFWLFSVDDIPATLADYIVDGVGDVLTARDGDLGGWLDEQIAKAQRNVDLVEDSGMSAGTTYVGGRLRALCEVRDRLTPDTSAYAAKAGPAAARGYADGWNARRAHEEAAR